MQLVVAKSQHDVVFESCMANRHGIISGATGTGKTVTLQVLAERFSEIGTPVFFADVKGDLSGIAKAGTLTPKLKERLETYQFCPPQFLACPVQFWDVFGKQGHPLRATVSDMGPLLLSRVLNLSDVQSAVLSLVFTIADAEQLLLLDFKDLKALLIHVQNSAKQYSQNYGQISSQSIAAIQRSLLVFEEEGVANFFGEPMLDIKDFLQTDSAGKGMINILAADVLYQHPRLYATFLLWLLSELFENFPEVGDIDKPRLVFFFDEAHLLFNDMPQIVIQKIEQVVRLIRSKGIAVFFITQSPGDIPERILGQLGNRIQHALRAYTPKDFKAVKTAAATFRKNPVFKTEDVIAELGVGEALVSFLDSKGVPGIVERAVIVPPRSSIGPITAEERLVLISNNTLYGKYEHCIDRESAYEILEKRIAEQALNDLITKDGWKETSSSQLKHDSTNVLYSEKSADNNIPERTSRKNRSQRTGATSQARGYEASDSIAEELLRAAGETLVRIAARSIGSAAGRKIVRGILGSMRR